VVMMKGVCMVYGNIFHVELVTRVLTVINIHAG